MENIIKFKIPETLKSNGIIDPVQEVVASDAGVQGAGFTSETKSIVVKFRSPEIPPLHLFAKVVSSNESHNIMLNEMKMFEKEANFLTLYLPAAAKFCKDKGFPNVIQSLYPKCYYADCSMIVMENLVLEKGFCLFSQSERQNLDTARLALKTLATHHAVSFAMVEECGGPDEFFRRFPLLDFDGFDKPLFVTAMGSILDNAMKQNIKILQSHEVEGKEETLSILTSFKNKSLMEVVLNCAKQNTGNLLVFNHGDYWNNNMMFLKDPTTDKIVGHKAIDFQVTRYNSPAWDLCYYMFTSVKLEVRKVHFEELLRHYLQILKSVANDLGHPIDLSIDHLYEQYRQKVGYGFAFAMCNGVGPGLEVMKGFDVSKDELKDRPSVFEKCMKAWIEKNPTEAEQYAKDVVEVAKEYISHCV